MLVGSLGKTITFCTVPRSRSMNELWSKTTFAWKKERNQLQPSMCNHPWSCLTCPQEEHFIAPINSIHLIHHQGSVPIVHTSSHHQGAAMDRINWMKHEGMGSDEIHSLIWKVLWGSDTRSEGSSRTLGGKKKGGEISCASSGDFLLI